MAGTDPTTDRWRAAEIAWSEGLEGRFRSMEQVAWRLSSDAGPEARAWGLALRALRWHAEPAMGQLPSLDEVAQAAGASEEAAHAAALATAQATKAAALRFDEAGVRRWADLASEQAAGARSEARAWCALASAWGHVARGAHELAEATASEACAMASEDAASAALLDGTALVALATSARDVDAAIKIARRGSRMARTEGLPQGEYLANVVLARLRRLAGRPHHATRILGALGRVAPRPWASWIVWELALAGGLEPASAIDLEPPEDDPGDDDATVAARAFVQALFAARDGLRDAFDARVEEARDALGSFEPLRADLANALVAIDPLAPPASPDREIAAWLTGVETRTPAALRGLSGIVEASSAEEGTAAFVVADPDGSARRVVALGHALAAPELRIDPQRGRPGRVETVLAALALAPDGLDTDDLFRTVYGFEYSAPVHRDLFKQLVYRARGELGSVGAIDKDGERYRLGLRGRLLVPDPRCEQPLEDLVLRFLARHGAGSAKATASTLKISLRKAQQALAQLADEGAIAIDKEGRRVSYRVEDTTFSEPTRV